MVVTVSYFNVHFSSLRLAFEKSDSLRGFESPLLQEGQGGGFPLFLMQRYETPQIGVQRVQKSAKECKRVQNKIR